MERMIISLMIIPFMSEVIDIKCAVETVKSESFYSWTM